MEKKPKTNKKRIDIGHELLHEWPEELTVTPPFKKLGKGGFGTVVKGTWKADQVVAVKVIGSCAKSMEETVGIEATHTRRAAQCVSENTAEVPRVYAAAVIQVRDLSANVPAWHGSLVGVANDAHEIGLIVLTFIDGEQLEGNRLAMTSLERTQAILQLALLLQCMHSQNLRHTDVKPHNIMVEKSTKKVFLIDIDKTHGTPDYGPKVEEKTAAWKPFLDKVKPQQTIQRSLDFMDATSDIYALGCTYKDLGATQEAGNKAWMLMKEMKELVSP